MTIIYMWYEDGQLRPFLVRLMTPISPFRGGRLSGPEAEGAQGAESADIG